MKSQEGRDRRSLATENYKSMQGYKYNLYLVNQCYNLHVQVENRGAIVPVNISLGTAPENTTTTTWNQLNHSVYLEAVYK